MLLLLMMRVACWQVRLLPCKSFLLTLCCRHSGLLANLDLMDVTYASRTGLMNIHTQTWDTQLATFYGEPFNIMPRILACGDIFGILEMTSLVGVNITGCMGTSKRQLWGTAAPVLACPRSPCFLLTNVGVRPIMSNSGLMPSVAFNLARGPTFFGLEGSAGCAGQALDWLNVGLHG